MGDDMEENAEEELAPRDYQSLLLEKCIQNNTILYLPTGSGKTYIAVMLIKHMSGDLGGDVEDGGKRTFFMVNTVALVMQQAKYIRRHTPLSVGHFTGDMNLDFWTKEVWHQHLNKYQVVVMTTQIFLDLLHHRYIKLKHVNLLIFDECHHGVTNRKKRQGTKPQSDHSMAQVMQLFNDCPVEQQPRVLGMTATILNSDCKPEEVKEQVAKLERTYRSKIETVDDVSLIERGFCTNPDEECHQFEDLPSSRVADEVKAHIKKMNEWIMSVKLEDTIDDPSVPENLSLMSDTIKTNKKLKNIMDEVVYHVNNLGLYGGSISAIKHIIQLERLKAKAEDEKELLVLLSMITTLNLVRKMMEDEMSNCDQKSRIYEYSSPKVRKLIKILRQLKPNEGEKVPRGIIFVERRFTAKVIAMILKYLHKYDDDFDFMKADFIVGYQNNPYKCTREGPMEKKWNTEALYRFNNGYTNIIASSDVLEEGIDVPSCNLVVKFDVPKSYRSYIQSKGRARFTPSMYAILVSSSCYGKFVKKYQTYHLMEQGLKEILASRKDTDVNVEKSIERKYSHLQYCVRAGDGISKVTMLSAISLVNRYCTTLPHDIFTLLAPCFYIKKADAKVQCILKLPMSSPVKDTIEGDWMPNKRLAKQSVALKTCELLHKAGELDDHLLPVGTRVDDIDDDALFLHWEDEKFEGQPRPGTKKCRRSHSKKIPSFFYQCAPQANAVVYLHVLQMKPTYQRPPQDESRKLAFYNLIQADEGFAILSSKKLPEICDFPIFLNVGPLNVSLKSNYREMMLTDVEIAEVQKFNTMIFYDLLKLCRSFMTVDLENKENSYLIVPTKLDPTGKHSIDWNVVQTHTKIPVVTKPSDCSQESFLAVIEDYNLSVVVPWYRSTSDQMYVVTRICHDMTPRSPFPSREYASFEDYYQKKYDLNVKYGEQPLVEVKAISNRLNCLKPRGKLGQSTSKRKRQELQEDFEEHFIPELCYRFSFPSALWLKATTLPSVLHRVAYLLIAEELRLNIAKDLSFDVQKDVRWETLTVDESCLEVPEPSSSVVITPLVNNILSSKRMGEAVPSASLDSEPLPWGCDEDEPVDIDRKFMEEITLVDVFYYDDFISKPVGNKRGKLPEEASTSPEHSPTLARPVDLHASAPIRILEVTLSSNGPQQYEILQALTAASSADIINMERLETLGDSFLKFSVSLFLFLSYSHINEGKLTELKGKMVGNRNLFYCGRNRGLNNILKVQDFSPKNDWIPPGFCVPRKLQSVLREANLCPNLLYEVLLPREDQLQGELSANTYRKLETQLLEWEHDNTLSSSAEFYIGNHIVPDKCVADCVEAVLGAYLKGYGVEGAAKLLGWFGIIPPDISDVCKLLESPAGTAFIASNTNKPEDINFHLPDSQIVQLEAALDYHFKDRSFLLQALTHASYIQNRVTDCYQRLEFLGDAILDFLITCYIYENCGNLSPGELTDLRSSLVNNITFGCLAVRNKFHQYCKYESVKLFDKIDTFVRFQESQNHEVNEKVLILVEEEGCHMAESIDVPKVLGDLFESLAGAVFLDSGKSLKEVWRVFYRLMKGEIDEFSKNIPKQPVRVLYETCNSVTFLRAKEIDNTNIVMVELEVMLRDEKKKYFGFGENKATAKRAAAKLALKDLS